MSKLKINGDKLKKLIQLKFGTQTAFARHIDRTDASVSRWVNNKMVPAQSIYIICNALGCELEDLEED